MGKKLLHAHAAPDFQAMSPAKRSRVLKEALFDEIIRGTSPNAQIITRLVAQGADVNGRRQNHGVESTPLICALGRWDTTGKHLAASLLESDADPNIPGERSSMQFFPLNLAVERDAKEMVELLLKHNANPDNADYGGYTPLMEASGRGNTEIVEMLLKAGANPDLKTDMKGETALTCAIRNGHSDIVQLLLKYGADINIETGMSLQKERALDIALGLARSTIARILMEHGAEASPGFVKEFGQKVNLNNREKILDACDQRLFAPIFQDYEF